jgi:hypothetical protein
MAKVWTTPLSAERVLHDSEMVIARAKEISVGQRVSDTLTWIDDETENFIRYWFAANQIERLTQLAAGLWRCRSSTRDALRLALSRIIITKDRGASLARDVSHSRPHKVASESDYDVVANFRRSAFEITRRITAESLHGSADVQPGDSRNLKTIADGTVDCVITSPPYLNALDYLRGHRLSLVWLGFTVQEVRGIRASSIGTERGLSEPGLDEGAYISLAGDKELPARARGFIRRYLRDARDVTAEIHRVLRPGGRVVLVVGNSNLKGVPVNNAQMYVDALETLGFKNVRVSTREIPAASRSLPPPSGGAGINARMRTEAVIEAKTSAPAAASPNAAIF